MGQTVESLKGLSGNILPTVVQRENFTDKPKDFFILFSLYLGFKTLRRCGPELPYGLSGETVGLDFKILAVLNPEFWF